MTNSTINIDCLTYSSQDLSDNRAENLNNALFNLGMYADELEFIPEGKDGKHTSVMFPRVRTGSYYQIIIPTNRFKKLLHNAPAEDVEALQLALVESGGNIFERLREGFLSTNRTYVARLNADNFIPHVEGTEIAPHTKESWAHYGLLGCLPLVVFVSAAAGLTAPLVKKYRETHLAKPPIQSIIESKKPQDKHADKIKDPEEKLASLTR